MLKKRPVLEVEEELMNITKRLSAKTASNLTKNKGSSHKNNKKATIKLKNSHGLQPNHKVNLFKDTKFFGSY